MIQLGSARRAARPHLANVLNSMGRLVLLPRGGWLKRGLKEHHCRSKEVQEDAVEIDDRAHFTVDDIREAIAASGACWRADMLLKEPIQGALTKCPTPMNFVSSAFTRSPALPASRALCRDVSWCPRRNSCSCRRHWATRTFKVGTDATFKGFIWRLEAHATRFAHEAAFTHNLGTGHPRNFLVCTLHAHAVLHHKL